MGGFGCIALFLLPFAVTGLGTAVLAVERTLQGNLHDASLFLLFAVVFGGAAAAGWRLLLFGRRKQREQEKLRAGYPEQPWMWRPDWASKRVVDSSRSGLWGSWIFAGLWNLIGLPSSWLALKSALRDGNTAAYAALVFPLAGAGLLTRAVRNTLRYRKYGISMLELSSLPGTIGHRLAGQVRASSELQEARTFQLTLSCIRRVTTGTGESRSTTEQIVWQEEQRVPAETSRDSAGIFVRIPFGFRIPSAAQATDSSNSDDQIVWRLEASADLPGVDYAASFEVPVFRTAESDLPATGEDLELTRAAGGPYQQPRNSRIRVSQSVRGTEMNFPAARAPGVAAGLTLFSAAWGGVLALLFRFRAPILFPVVFGFFEVLLLIGVVQLWLYVSRVLVRKGSIAISDGYLMPGSERTISAGEIAEITTRIDMQMGTRPYYDILVLTTKGKKIAAGRWLRDKREAEWLAATMREGLGLRSISPEEPGFRTPVSSTDSSARRER